MRHDRKLARAGYRYLFACHRNPSDATRADKQLVKPGDAFVHQPARGIKTRRRFYAGASLLTLVSVLIAATTSAGAFTLGGPVVAGLYQYQLFRGPDSGGSADDQNSWFLRSHLAGPNPVPIYRPEGAIYAAMPSMGRELTRNTIGTFHDYNGDQGLVRGNGASGRSWGRVFGEVIEQGHAYGFQTGADLFESESPSGVIDRFGVFFGYAQARGEVRGFALGVQNNYVGDSSLEGLSGGAYWTRIGPRDEYLEARVVGTHYSGDGRSFANNMTVNVKGTSFAASLEGGYPIRFANYTIEPQAQLIYQTLDMNGRDPMSSIGYDTPDALYARVGLRLSSDGLLGWSNVKPYLKANVWQDEVGTDRAIFAGTECAGGGAPGAVCESFCWDVLKSLDTRGLRDDGAVA